MSDDHIRHWLAANTIKGEITMDFVIGDVVQLKSGGPRLTVTYIRDAGAHKIFYGVVWFNDGKVETAEFPKESLEQVQRWQDLGEEDLPPEDEEENPNWA